MRRVIPTILPIPLGWLQEVGDRGILEGSDSVEE